VLQVQTCVKFHGNVVSSLPRMTDCKPSRRTDLVKYVRSGGERIAVKRMCCALLGKHLGVC